MIKKDTVRLSDQNIGFNKLADDKKDTVRLTYQNIGFNISADDKQVLCT